ncbi:hypothetical protein CYG48_10635 [Neorhizobium sp. SOG26]|jgi:hypothetical protein|uniref:hypothetical protein n=1 Tax=Neorhizobium sp. SOG26 TaxID=2060726 RepID=UPI000E5772E1|nr:hypothetical protein [Neorhizobium sp. SOG26]AXV16107.1 hypothetical protein CYG48_10635 [Neorhizobium sp. SOG26]
MQNNDLPDRIPPVEVAEAAEKGLKLRAQYRRGGTMVGVARARDLKNRKNISEQTIRRMVSYFARHKVDKRAENFGDDENPSTGYIAWLLWGGDAGQKWAEQHKKAMEKAKNEARMRRYKHPHSGSSASP